MGYFHTLNVLFPHCQDSCVFVFGIKKAVLCVRRLLDLLALHLTSSDDYVLLLLFLFLFCETKEGFNV